MSASSRQSPRYRVNREEQPISAVRTNGYMNSSIRGEDSESDSPAALAEPAASSTTRPRTRNPQHPVNLNEARKKRNGKHLVGRSYNSQRGPESDSSRRRNSRTDTAGKRAGEEGAEEETAQLPNEAAGTESSTEDYMSWGLMELFENVRSRYLKADANLFVRRNDYRADRYIERIPEEQRRRMEADPILIAFSIKNIADIMRRFKSLEEFDNCGSNYFEALEGGSTDDAYFSSSDSNDSEHSSPSFVKTQLQNETSSEHSQVPLDRETDSDTFQDSAATGPAQNEEFLDATCPAARAPLSGSGTKVSGCDSAELGSEGVGDAYQSPDRGAPERACSLLVNNSRAHIASTLTTSGAEDSAPRINDTLGKTDVLTGGDKAVFSLVESEEQRDGDIHSSPSLEKRLSLPPSVDETGAFTSIRKDQLPILRVKLCEVADHAPAPYLTRDLIWLADFFLKLKTQRARPWFKCGRKLDWGFSASLPRCGAPFTNRIVTGKVGGRHWI